MNPELTISKQFINDELLKLTSKGYSTREAKRKLKKDRKKRFTKLEQDMMKSNKPAIEYDKISK